MVHDSISSLFVLPANRYQSLQSPSDNASGQQGAKFEWHPKTWKMYLAMNVAFTIAGYPLGDLWLLAPDGPLNQLYLANGDPWPTWAKVIPNLLVLVPVVVYVAVPVVIYYSAHWLFTPWIKSSNPIVSVLEEGFRVASQTALVQMPNERACRRRCGVARCVKTSGRDSTLR